MSSLWLDLAARAGQTLSEQQVASMNAYLDLLLAANQSMNLTRIVERSDAERLHVGDALTLLPHLPAGPCRVADIGSGGGVPGIPLAIARPEVSFLLIESTRKKAAFLREVAATLELENVQVSDRRVEEIGRTGARNSFDVVTARAVALLPWLIEWSLPLLKPTGRLLAMKGAKAESEVVQSSRAVKLLAAAKPVIHPSPLPETQDLAIIEVAKRSGTPAAYPRASSVTGGRPL